MSGTLVALCIAAAGGLGAAVRYLVDTSPPARLRARFPWGIAVVNLTGSFALGVVAGAAIGHPVAEILSIGLLGGYTTFSTASLDTVQLLRQRRILAALANGPGVLVAGVALAALGLLLGRA